MRTAAIYLRVSTRKQLEEGASLDTQYEGCRKLAESLGYEVREECTVREDWPGSTLDRPGLDSLRSLIAQKAVTALIAYSTDRLARNPVHLALLAEECDKRGVELLFVTEPLDTSLEGQLIRYVKGYASAVEREKIRERTMRGKREWARRGKLTSGNHLFGYKYIEGEGRREVHDEEAKVVQLIFRKVVDEGWGLARLAGFLNGFYPPPRGRYWNTSSLYYMLTNPAYCGETWAFRYVSVEPDNPVSERRRYSKSTRRVRDKEEWIAVPNATPPIIDRATFDAAQAQLQRNKTGSVKNKKYQYLLAGRLRCGLCGRKMFGKMNNARRPSRYRMYCCLANRAVYFPRCRARPVRADEVEQKVWEAVERVIRHPEVILSELHRQQDAGTFQEIAEERKGLERELERIDREGARLVRLYTTGEIDEEWLDGASKALKDAKERVKGLLAELTQREQRAANTIRSLESARLALERVTRNLQEFTFEDKRTALEALGIVATITRGEIRVDGVIPLDEEAVSKLSCPSSSASQSRQGQTTEAARR